MAANLPIATSFADPRNRFPGRTRISVMKYHGVTVITAVLIVPW
jgi:hypothetical protein